MSSRIVPLRECRVVSPARLALVVAALALLAAVVTAQDITLLGDAEIATKLKAAPGPLVQTQVITGGHALLLDMGAVQGEGGARAKLKLSQRFEVGDEGAFVQLRHSYKSDLANASLRVTGKLRRVVKSPLEVDGAKPRMKVAKSKGKSGKGGGWIGAFDDVMSEQLLAPGEYLLTLKLSYRKSKADGGWSNSGVGASPHRFELFVPSGQRLVVDPKDPDAYASLAAALAAAQPGDSVRLGKGVYGDGEPIELTQPIRLEGLGRDLTVIDGALFVSAPDTGVELVVRELACDGVYLNFLMPQHAPVRVSGCRVDAVGIGNTLTPTGYVIEFSQISTGAGFSFGNGPGEIAVRYCEIGTGVGLSVGAGASFDIVGNTILTGGIADASLACSTRFAGNILLEPGAGIADASGGQGGGVEDQFIEANRLHGGSIVCNSASVTIRDNLLISSDEFIGTIRCSSGDPTNVIGNTVQTPYAPEGPDAFDVFRTSAGPGVVRDNVFIGGTFGVIDSSAADFLDNLVVGAHVGVLSAGGGRWAGNTIRECVDDGVQLGAVPGPFEANTVADNGGAGVRVLSAGPDLGGGALGGLGGNVLTGNAGFDLVVEVPVAEAATLFAEGNFWDHASASEVHALDVLDGQDDPAVAAVSLEPLGGSSN